MERPAVLLIALVILICAVILQLFGLASPYWISNENSIDPEKDSATYAGLWKMCTCKDTGDYLQNDIDISNSQLRTKSSQTMSILGFVALMFASGLTILKLCFLKHMKPLLIVSSISAFVGAFFIAVSILLFAADVNNAKLLYRYEFHFAFAFSILAMIIAFMSGGFMILEIPK
ncbi:uncharacterized protein LOC134245943 [Saccostrea cucullata]|uniref:uncharacterized protein LOC134245943 n=1 Tax=Saccostrea cuccullata TaxID=36930 RepID=UPI002ED32F98